MADRIEGLSIGLSLDTIQVDAGLKDLRTSMSLLNSEMKANLSQFDMAEKSAQKYEVRLEGLNKKVELQEQITEKARKTYEKMVAEYGEGSSQAQKAARSYNNQSAKLQNLQRSVDKTTREYADFREEQRKNESSLKKFSDQAEKTGAKLTKVGDATKELGKSLTEKVSAPLLAAGGLLIKQSSDVEGSQVRMQNALGLTAEKAAEVADVARDVYQEGWGESLDHVEGAMLSVIEQMDVLDDPDQLDNATRKALQLEKVFDMDMNESLRGVNALMTTYGMTADEAFDYMTRGAQNGLDKTDELGDNLAEYATLFEENGYSAEEMFSILQAGLDAGAYNLDKVNDLVKEFGIRVGDQTIKDAVDELGGSWAQIYETWEKSGESNDVLFQKLAENLASIEDPQQKQLALTEIWGSMGEDAGYKVIEAMGGVQESYSDVAGASDELVEKQEETFGQQFQSLLRDAADSFLPLGETLLEMARDYLPELREGVADLTDWLKEMDSATLENIIKWGGFITVAGPVLTAFGSIMGGVGGTVTAVSKLTGWIAGAGGLTPALGLVGGKLASVAAFLSGPWGLALAAGASASVLLYDSLTTEAIPAVQGFGDEVSDTTAEAVMDFISMSGDVQTELDLMFANGTVITEEGAEALITQFQTMGDTIAAELDADFDRNLTNLNEFFSETSVMNSEHEERILSNMQANHKSRNEALQGYEDRAQEIMATAKEEKRALTQAEHDELSSIREDMNTLAVNYLSESALEQVAIQDSLRVQSGAINARQAAETVQKSKEAKDGAIAEANERADETIQTAIYLRDVTGDLSAEEADAIIEEAERQRKGAIDEANERHDRVIDIAKEQAGDHVDEVDWETGEVLSRWDVFTNDLVKGAKEGAQETLDSFKEAWDDIKRTGNELNDWVEDLVQVRIPRAVRNGYSAVKGAFARFINGGIEAVESGVNKIIGGVNWVLDKLGSSTRVSKWNAPRVNSGSGRSGSTQGITHARYATGTDSHPGGPAIVGDGGMRELVLYPNGHMALSPDTDTLLDLPRGTQVLSGPETKDLLDLYDIPAYKSGIGNVLGSIWDWVSGGAKNLMNKALNFLNISPPDIAGALGGIAKAGFNLVKNEAIGFFERNKDKFMGPPGGINFRGLRKTSGYGPRRSPGGIGSTYHRGVDYAGPLGSVIQSQTPGVVAASSYHPLSGNYVQVRQGRWQYRYQHNLRNLVRTGQSVRKGQPLALLGSTGASTGPHLHFEIWRDGRRINPEPFIGGFADGGLVNQEGLYQLAEGGYPEFVIPTDPDKRTDAMKLLAIAAKQLQANKAPHQMPAPASTGDGGVMAELLQATLEQNKILRALLEKDIDVNISRDRLADEVNQQNAYNELGGFFNV